VRPCERRVRRPANGLREVEYLSDRALGLAAQVQAICSGETSGFDQAIAASVGDGGDEAPCRVRACRTRRARVPTCVPNRSLIRFSAVPRSGMDTPQTRGWRGIFGCFGERSAAENECFGEVEGEAATR